MARQKVAIIGSGPAGLFAAHELFQNKDLEVIVYEREKYSSGGMMNDCKLNLNPHIGMNIGQLGITEEQAVALIGEVDKQFLLHGAPQETTGENESKIERIVAKADRCDLKLIPARQRHVGTDCSRALIDSFKSELLGKGVQFVNGCEVEQVLPQEKGFTLVVEQDKREQGVSADYVIACPGRASSGWFREQADNLGIEYELGPIDIGVRLELPREFYDEVTDVLYDPKFIMDFGDPEYTRTFCTNPGGRIRIEADKALRGLKLINGDARQKKKTSNTNLAIMTRFFLTEPLVDTREEGRKMAETVLRFGDGKPLIQRVGDFMARKRSWPKDFELKGAKNGIVYVEPTLPLNRVTPGDIHRAYPSFVAYKMQTMLERLDRLVSGGGILNPGNILYAPELKLYDVEMRTGSTMETTVPNIYVAGDGVGKSRGIVGAALTGILAAKGLLAKLE